jgi:hypothetical protein
LTDETPAPTMIPTWVTRAAQRKQALSLSPSKKPESPFFHLS